MATQDSVISQVGLFTTPEQYQQQLDQQALANSVTLAQLTPEQSARQAARMAGYNIAGGIAGAMGAQDPMLKLQSLRNQLGKQFDTSTAEGLTKLSFALRDAGDIQGAAQAGRDALAAREKEAIVYAKMKEGVPEQQKLAATIADTSFQRGTPEWADAFKSELYRLTAGNKGANIKEIGVAEGSRQPVYFDAGTDTQFIMRQNPQTGKQERVPFNGGVDRTTARTNVDARNMSESKFMQELAVLDAKQVADAFKTREAAIGELDTLSKMSRLNQQQMTTGAFASGRVAVGNLLSTIGIASDKDKIATSKSEEYQKYAGSLLLDKIKKLGTNPSNTDREFVARIIPQLENSAQARQELLDYMAAKAKEVISETTRLEEYARDKNGLKGYKPTIPLVSTGGVSSLSDDELIRQIRAERAKQGNK